MTIQKSVVVVRVAVTLGFALACSGGGGKPVDAGAVLDANDEDAQVGTDAGDVTPSDVPGFLLAYASAVCAMYQPCCEAEGLGYDASGCTDWFRDVTAAYWGGEEYRAEEGMACLQALAAARAADANRCSQVRDFDQATLREMCSLAITSPINQGAALGESCLLSMDCAGTAEEGSVICYGGNCLLEQRGVAGDGPCFFGAGDGIEGPRIRIATCEASDGLYCDRSVNQCAPEVDDGELCARADACKATALCSGGICRTLPGPGEPCLNGIPGAGGYCRAGSACDAQTVICSELLADGAPCRDANQCASHDCDVTCQPSTPEFTSSLNCTGG